MKTMKTRKEIMRRAWEIAREYATVRQNKTKDNLGAAMRDAWAEAKASENEFKTEVFEEKARQISQDLKKRDGEETVRLWEMRKAMNSPENYEEEMKRLEKESKLYFIAHSKPGELEEHKLEGSIEDKLHGLLFYAVWRS